MEGQLVPYQQTGTLPVPTSAFSGEAAANGFLYDAAGNVFNDNVNTYLYDGEGRICAVMSAPAPGMRFMTGYLYDADGTRVAKGTITSMSCDPAVNGFQTTSDYVLDLSDEQVTEVGVNANGTLAHQHTNVWAGGKLLGTYDDDGLHFYLDDPLGTRRVQTDYAGVIEQQCASFPFGDGETCTTTPTEHLFTGKERDTESGNDYFGARYYASGMGRWMSPDWSAEAEPIPYAKLGDPQSFNLYAYVRNNPFAGIDIDGHTTVDGVELPAGLAGSGESNQSQAEQNAENQKGNKAKKNGNPADVASMMENTSAYLEGNDSKYPAGANKCNEFVADMIEASGIPRPKVKKSRIQGRLGIYRDPTAKEWSEGKVPGYRIIPLSQAQRGDVIAMGHNDDDEGHVGIYMGNGQTASVNALTNPRGIVTINDWGFRGAGNNGEHKGDSGPVALRYVGGNP